MVLKKSLSGLGFSFSISQLHSGPDRGSVVRIKRLFPGQPALESGLLREGDVILSVNKEPVKDLSYQVGFGVLKFIIINFIIVSMFSCGFSFVRLFFLMLYHTIVKKCKIRYTSLQGADNS